VQVSAVASEIAALVSGTATSTIVRQCGGALRAAQQPASGSRQGNVAGGMVRLAFHDAATFAGVGVAGGPDGCIDLTNKAENGGLEQTVALLDCVFANSSARALGAFSRADLWALAGSTAAVVTMPRATSGNVAISFRSGRVDNPNCAATDKGLFPSAEGDLASVVAIFQQRLGPCCNLLCCIATCCAALQPVVLCCTALCCVAMSAVLQHVVLPLNVSCHVCRPHAARDGRADGRALARACRAGQHRVQRRVGSKRGVA
jgi:hypothetical protein